MMNIYDEAAEINGANHRVHYRETGGWDCSCGAGSKTVSPNTTRQRSVAAANRHLATTYMRYVNRLRDDREKQKGDS